MKRIVVTLAAMLIFAAAALGQAAMMDSNESAGIVVNFADLDDVRELAEAGPTVLFFSADWCPLCRADLKEINAGLDSLSGIAVVVVDYDRARNLRKRYGVTYQHTYVQIDADGEKLALWNGGGVEGILEHVEREGMM